MKEKPYYALRLSELRSNKGFTQQKVADDLEITRGRLNNYEQGTREPDIETLKKLAEYFYVSTDYLLGKSDFKNHIETVALHRTDDPKNDLPQEALDKIEEFKELMRMKYQKKPTSNN